MSPDSHSPLFELRQLGLNRRARPILRNVNWRWEPGQHWALLGPNGAGKTSLAGILAGEEHRYSGTYDRGEALRTGTIAYVCFERARRLCDRDRKLDCAEFEASATDTGTRVMDLLPPEAAANERQAVVEMLGLDSLLERGLRYLSTGEMRKTLLASALLEKPALMILDSPLDGLDRATQEQLGIALDSLIGSTAATLVLCRNPSDVPAACQRVALIDSGRLVEMGTRDEILHGSACRQLMTIPPITLSPPTLPESVANTTDEPTIELKDVNVSFGEHRVIRDANWTLERHQHCLISGPNGCGKSTLLDLLTGDNHKAYGQQVSLFGRLRGTGESVWDIKAKFGRVDARMQNAMPNGSTVLETVISGFFDSLGLFDRPSDQQRDRALRWLRVLGLAEQQSEEFATLSFGLQRLVLLARAMVKGPAILLLDEATLSLDASHAALLLKAVDHVISHSETQLLFVSHSPGDTPNCINQVMTFTPHEDGSTILVENRIPGGDSPVGHPPR